MSNLSRHRRVNDGQKSAKFHRPVPAVALPDHLAGRDVKRGEQRRGAVAPVVMRAPLRHAGPERQHRLRAVQRLNLCLFVDTQHDRALGRMQIQPDDVTDFLHKQRVLRQLEGLGPMRLQTERPPDAAHRRRAEAAGLSHRPGAPMRRRRRQRFQRLHYHPLNVAIPDAPRCARARRVQQPVGAGLHEAAPPFADSLARRTAGRAPRARSLPPSAHASTIRARDANACDVLLRRSQRCSSSRWSAANAGTCRV